MDESDENGEFSPWEQTEHLPQYLFGGFVAAILFASKCSTLSGGEVLFFGLFYGSLMGWLMAIWVPPARRAFTSDFWTRPDPGILNLTTVPTIIVAFLYVLWPREPGGLAKALGDTGAFNILEVFFATLVSAFFGFCAFAATGVLGMIVEAGADTLGEDGGDGAAQREGTLEFEARRLSDRLGELVRERDRLAGRIDRLRAPRDRMRRIDPDLYGDRLETLKRAILTLKGHLKELDELITTYETLREKVIIELEMYEAEAILPESGHGHGRMQLRDELARVREADRALQDRIEAEIELDRHLRG